MAETVEQAARAETLLPPIRPPQCVCELTARATERAALASARWLGRADQEGAEEAAFSGMRASLDVLAISGRVVIGAPEGSRELAMGDDVGAGGREVDLALDP